MRSLFLFLHRDRRARARSLVLAACLFVPLGADAQLPPPPAAADSAAALEAFRANIAAIHQRDRAAYLSAYLASPRLTRTGPEGVSRGWEDFRDSAGETFPDTLVASHFQVTPLARGIAYGSYHYRVVQDGTSGRGVSERVLVETDDGWKVAVTTAFGSDPLTPPPPFALTGATLIDGTGAPPLRNAVVLMRGGRIDCVGTVDACPLPPDVEVVDARGQWIIPGLVDTHVHFSQTGWADGRPDALDLRADYPYDRTVSQLRAAPERFYQSYLCAGVTAVFDVGGYPWTWELRERAARSPTSAPHVAAAGPLLSTRDHWLNVPAERQFLPMTDRDAVRANTEYLLSAGTDAVKIWYLGVPDPAEARRQREYLQLAARWARDGGVPLIVHATSLEGAREAVESGAHLLVHSVESELVDDAFLRAAAQRGTFYNPTLTVHEGYRELRAREFDESRTEAVCVDPSTLERARSTRELPGRPDRAALDRAAAANRVRFDRMEENLRRVHAAGIPVVLGTDAGNPLTLHGPAVYHEMEAMVQAGLSPMEVLVASTRNGARALGMGDQIGTVEEGKWADLLVLGADPLADIRGVRALRLVVKGGEIYTRWELTFPAPE